MRAFETTAVLEDALHLTLRDPLPHHGIAQECRIIVVLDAETGQPSAWPPGFFEDIRVTDPTFVRPPQGEVPPVAALD